MPTKFRLKEFVPGGIYHIYNRGVDGREIFRDTEDFEKFINLLKYYVCEFDEDVRPGYKQERPYIIRRKRQMNLHGEVGVLAYCLMADHFDLLVRQSSGGGVTKLMRRVVTGYMMYFNKKYKRRGTIFEGIYKAIKINEQDLLSVCNSIHMNPVVRKVVRFGPVETITGTRPEDYRYSSYNQYAGTQEVWIDVLGNG